MELSKAKLFSSFCVLYFTGIAYCDAKIAKRTTRILAFRKGSTFFDATRIMKVRDNAADIVRAFAKSESGGFWVELHKPIEICHCQYRMNYKITSFPKATPIFAQAAGFKVAWELPTSSFLDNRVGRSLPDIHESAELVYESHGFDGRSCLLKNICYVLEYVRRKDGVMAKILKLLAGPYINNYTSTDAPPTCSPVHVENCPLRFLGFDAFSEKTTDPHDRAKFD